AEALRERAHNEIHGPIHLRVDECPITALEDQAERHTDASLRQALPLVAVEELDGNEIRAGLLADLLEQLAGGLIAIDQHREVATDRGLARRLAEERARRGQGRQRAEIDL